MPYSTIIFDLSEVLIRGLIGVEKTLFPLVGGSESQILLAFCGDNLNKLCEGKITEDEYLEAIFRNQQWEIPINDVKRHIRQNFRHTITGMVRLVSCLSKQYRLILLSDHAREWMECIEARHSFLALFTTRIFSFDLGSTKDKPGTFEAALTIMNKLAGECLFIDDNFRNVETARKSGIDGIYFTDKQALLPLLEQRGVFVPQLS